MDDLKVLKVCKQKEPVHGLIQRENIQKGKNAFLFPSVKIW